MSSRQYFLLSYFHGKENGSTGAFLAVSEDGHSFETVNHGRPVATPQAGLCELMRDPFIVREPGKDLYHMVWTTSWTGKDIGYASSPNLLEWSGQRVLPVMDQFEGTQNCWAPEIIYDEAQEDFVLFWSSTVLPDGQIVPAGERPPRDHRIYCTRTRDFRSMSPSTLMFDPGYNVIDASFLKSKDKLILFFKDERLVPEKKNIRWAVAETPVGPFGPISEPITGSWVEGPSAVGISEKTVVYFDRYTEGTYGAVETSDFEQWRDVSDRIAFPSGASHGSVITISEERYIQLAATRSGPR